MPDGSDQRLHATRVRLRGLWSRVWALTLGLVLTLTAAVLAEITHISVSPTTPMPVGVIATYKAELDTNAPAVTGFTWSWRGVGCGEPYTWYQGGTQQTWTTPEDLVGGFQVKCVVTHAGMPPPPAYHKIS